VLFGWVAQGWNVNELNTRKTCSAAGPRCVVGGGVWGVGMVVVVLVVVFSTQTFWGLLERIMAGVVMMYMFGALLGFEATSLLTGIVLLWVVVVGAWCFGVCPVSAARWSLV
jgi:hypothetical protein